MRKRWLLGEDIPDQNGLLDAELARVELHPHKPPSSWYEPLIRKHIAKRVRDEDNEVDGEGWCIGLEEEDLGSACSHGAEEGPKDQYSEGKRG